MCRPSLPSCAGRAHRELLVRASGGSFGELLQVQQLPAGHHQVADGDERSKPTALRDNDFEHQASAVTGGCEHVGHHRAQDPSRQLLARIGGQDAPQVAGHPNA